MKYTKTQYNTPVSKNEIFPRHFERNKWYCSISIIYRESKENYRF